MIGADGKPLGLILFADKSKISSFGTLQGYPVIARIANLESDVRNGRSFGGGCVVGFLPVVKQISYMSKGHQAEKLFTR